MPVGATLAAAATVAGSTVYASNKASSATKKATNAQTQSADQALDFQRYQYDQNRADFAPWRAVGVGALQQLARTFNISVPDGTWSSGAAPAPVPVGSGTVAGQGSTATSMPTGGGATGLVGGIVQKLQNDSIAKSGDATFGDTRPTPEQPIALPAPAAGMIQPAATGTGRFGDFFASPDYNFRLTEGQRALTGNYAARGLMDSGAAGKGLIDYAEQSASQEFGGWFNRLASLAGIGQTATSQLAGLNSANANSQAGLIQNRGEALASGYATQGGIQAGLINQLGNTGAGLIRNLAPQPAPQLAPNWQSMPGFVGSGNTTGLEGLY